MTDMRIVRVVVTELPQMCISMVDSCPFFMSDGLKCWITDKDVSDTCFIRPLWCPLVKEGEE